MKTLFSLSLLGGGMTLLLAGLKGQLLSRCGGRWYCFLWILALLAFCVPYKLEFMPKEPAAEHGMLLGEETAPIETGLFPMPTGQEERGKEVSLAKLTLEKIYVGGGGLLLLYYGGVYLVLLRKQKRESYRVREMELWECFQRVCGEMGIKKQIGLWKNPSLSSPLLLGILKTQVILPCRAFEEGELELIFRHELTHHKRRDLLFKGAALGVHIFHWFNPLSYLALKNINEACEYACDEAVTGKLNGAGRRAYGMMLLNQIRAGRKGMVFFAGLDGRGQRKKVLERRIDVIMDEKRKTFKGLGIAAVFGLGLVIGGNFFDFQAIYGGNENAKAEVLGENFVKPAEEIETKQEAIVLTRTFVETLFDAQKEPLEFSADYYKNSEIQPDGWFVRAGDAEWEYALWLEDNGRLRVARASQSHPTQPLSEEEIDILQEERSWAAQAEQVLREKLGERGEIREIYFEGQAEEEREGRLERGQRTVDLRVYMADGTGYLLSFYPMDGVLKALTYLPPTSV